jgi:hypothetical protein
MAVGVSIPSTGLSLATGGVSLYSTTLYLPYGGESILGIQVSLFTSGVTPPPPASGTGILDFRLQTSAVNIILLGGFP